jgi:sulfoxide reductase heme-binding subunit YedZ
MFGTTSIFGNRAKLPLAEKFLMERQIAGAKAFLFLICLLPLAYYGINLWQDTLGVNPMEAFTRGLGDWALRLLLITLAVTPLRRLTGWIWLMRLRRMLGLFAFFYVCLHLTTYLWLDQSFDWLAIGMDILKRPFIAAGILVFMLLVPLAATSTNAMIRRLGGKRWQQLHRLIYPAAMIAVVHYTWMIKADATQPAIYGIALALLLGLRLWWYFQDARKPLLARHRIIPIQVRR